MTRRDDVRALPLYKQGDAQGVDAVKLSSNENPYPPLPSVLKVVTEQLAGINRYPLMAAAEVRSAIAVRHGVEPDQVAVGAGSTEVASQIIHAVAGAGDEVVFAWRSFEAYPILTRVAGATPVPVPLTADLRHDLPAMAAAVTDRTRLVFLCTPNNPTGTTLSTGEVEDFLAQVPDDVVVVLDEAYTHFNRDQDAVNGLDLVRRYPNVISLKTFSKAYGLAGLRIGFAVSSTDLSDDLRRVATPFTVTNLAQRAAMASLLAEDELAERVELIVAERERLRSGLLDAGWPVGPSQANFLWLALGADTDRVDAGLRAAGVFARSWSGEGIRLSVGSVREDDRALAALASLRS
ncbi:histidinol-phosphate transaminase [Acidipropionibacterium timonense]|uniref:histidinol-phosphate transaminase n=1 Tax=Acidipropionibacterium timonense TaxID=2161818 RepID=UPI00102F667E|nr:histidinol-phosphate transaminase [Acidipropionibacterium timonense]